MRPPSRVVPFVCLLVACSSDNAVTSPMTTSPAPDSGPSRPPGSDASAVDSNMPPVPHVVSKCDALSSVDHWDAITPPGVTSVMEVLVDPIHAGTIYAGTDKTGVYRSTDCGATWTKTNTGANANVIDTGTQWNMALDPSHPEVVYAGSLYGSNDGLFKSTNEGVDWQTLFPPGSEIDTHVPYDFFQEMAMDATNSQHIIISFHADCAAPYSTRVPRRNERWRQ